MARLVARLLRSQKISQSSPVSMLPVIKLFFRISPRIFVKIRNGSNGSTILSGLKSKISCKTPFTMLAIKMPLRTRNVLDDYNVFFTD